MQHVRRFMRRIVPQGTMGRGVVLLVGATTIGQGLIVASSPILTRLYSPHDLGIYSVAASILITVTVISSLSYQVAVVIPDDDVSAANVLALSLLTTVLVSVLAGVILLIAALTLKDVLDGSAVSAYVLPLVLGAIGGGGVLALTSWATRTKSFSDIAATRLTQSGTLVGAQLGLGLLRLGSLGLFVGSVAGSIAGLGRLSRSAWRTHAWAFRQVSMHGIVDAAKRYRRFPVFAAPSDLINTVGLQGPLLLMVALYGASIGGQYALAVRIGSLPVTLVAAGVAQVFLGEAAPLVRGRHDEMLGLFWRTTATLAIAALVPFALLAVMAYLFAPAVFGSSWQEAGTFVAILTPMYYMQLVMNPTGVSLALLERQDLLLVREVSRAVIMAGAIVVASASHLAPMIAVVVLSVAGSAVYALYGGLTWHSIVTARRVGVASLPLEGEIARHLEEL